MPSRLPNADAPATEERLKDSDSCVSSADAKSKTQMEICRGHDTFQFLHLIANKVKHSTPSHQISHHHGQLLALVACKTQVLSNGKACILSFLSSFAAHLRCIGVPDEEKRFPYCSCVRSNLSVATHWACSPQPHFSTSLDIRSNGIRPRPNLSRPMAPLHLYRPCSTEQHSIACR